MTLSYQLNPLFQHATEWSARIESASTFGGAVTWDDLPGDARASWMQEASRSVTPMFAIIGNAATQTLGERLKEFLKLLQSGKVTPPDGMSSEELVAATAHSIIAGLFQSDPLPETDEVEG